MTTYYVGPGGNDGNNGTSWATRKLTLNGAEDIPVAAGDTVYVGPGTYRELLTCDVSGSSGSPITYIGDVTGEHTDGIGGVVRITGSDNDTAATRANIIAASDRSYRTFRGFYIDSATDSGFQVDGTYSDWIIEDCSFQEIVGSGVMFNGSQSSCAVRRCIFAICGRGVQYYHTSDVSNCSNTVDNCILLACDYGIRVVNIGGIAIKNCSIVGCTEYGVRVEAAPAAGQTITINNSIVRGNNVGLRSVTGFLIEDYNNIGNNGTDLVSVSIGANTQNILSLFEINTLHDGIAYPGNIFALSKWSQIARIAGAGEPTDDIYGITRPTTSAKKSWGAIQYIPTSRTTGIKYAGSASLKLPDAGAHQMFVPSANTTTSISVQCYIEGNYNGTQPQVIIKQPGQSDRTNTRTGSTSAWVEITDSFTPAATPPYFVLEMRSNNTTSVGSFATYFDDLTVT